MTGNPDLGRLAKHSASLNADRHAEAATPDTLVQEGADRLARQAMKIATGLNPDLKDHGIIPWETDVGAGLSLRAAGPLKDLPGGLLASLAKYFTRELPPGLMPSEPVDVPLAMLGELHPMPTPDMGEAAELGV
jgi:hypothetical protein